MFWRGGAVLAVLVFGAFQYVAYTLPEVYESEAIVESRPFPGELPVDGWAAAERLRAAVFEPRSLEKLSEELASEGLRDGRGSSMWSGPSSGNGTIDRTRQGIAIRPLGEQRFAIVFRAPSAALAQRGADSIAAAAGRQLAKGRAGDATAQAAGGEAAKARALEDRTRELAAFVAQHPELATKRSDAPSETPSAGASARSAPTAIAPTSDSVLAILQQQKARLEARLAEAEKEKEKEEPSAPADASETSLLSDPGASVDRASLQKMLTQVRAAITARQGAAQRARGNSPGEASATPESTPPPAEPPARAALQVEWQRLLQAVVEAQQELAKSRDESSAPPLRVVQAAYLPSRPIKPNRPFLALLGVTAALWSAILWAFARVALGAGGRPSVSAGHHRDATRTEEDRPAVPTELAVAEESPPLLSAADFAEPPEASDLPEPLRASDLVEPLQASDFAEPARGARTSRPPIELPPPIADAELRLPSIGDSPLPDAIPQVSPLAVRTITHSVRSEKSTPIPLPAHQSSRVSPPLYGTQRGVIDVAQVLAQTGSAAASALPKIEATPIFPVGEEGISTNEPPRPTSNYPATSYSSIPPRGSVPPPPREPEVAPKTASVSPSRITQSLGTPILATRDSPPPQRSAAAVYGSSPPAERSAAAVYGSSPPAERSAAAVHGSSPPTYEATLSSSPSQPPPSTALAVLRPDPEYGARNGPPPPPAGKVSVRNVPRGWTPHPSLSDSESLAELSSLRDQLYRLAVHDCFVVGVSSGPEMAAYKSNVAGRLAWLLAQPQHARVLLMEGDFDHPVVHRLMRVDMPLSSGFSEQMRQRMNGATPEPWTLVRCTPSLYVLAEGLVRSPGLLPTMQFAEAVTELRRYYDLIVIDGPAAGMNVDTRALDGVADGIVLAGESDLLDRASNWFKKKQLMAVVSVGPNSERWR